MTKKEAIEWLIQIKDKYIHDGDEQFDAKRKEVLDMAIEALERTDTHECVDLISREDALDILDDFQKDIEYGVDSYAEHRDRLYSLSEQLRPKGKWILEEQKSQNHIENIYICSSCRNFEAWGKTELYNFRPNCGAKMEGTDD